VRPKASQSARDFFIGLPRRDTGSDCSLPVRAGFFHTLRPGQLTDGLIPDKIDLSSSKNIASPGKRQACQEVTPDGDP
jgi:hypothetical protein